MKRRLELRRTNVVIIGYIVSAIVAGILFSIEGIFSRINKPFIKMNVGDEVSTFIGSTLIVAVVSIFVELIFITPLLVSFKKYHWPWLNVWTGAFIGFCLAGLPAFYVGVTRNADGTSEAIGYYVENHLSQLGLRHAISNMAHAGPIGAASAVVFRLIAVRKTQE